MPKCPKCGGVFEGKPERCPSCDAKFAWKEATAQPPAPVSNSLPVEGKEKKIAGKNGFYVFLNVVWIILFGWELVVIQAVEAIVFFVTLIGIPNGLALFRTMKVLWHPLGRKVTLHFGSHGFLNVWWLIWGGWINPILLYIWGAFLCVTVLFIPIGLQVFKLAKAYWAPHGCELSYKGE